MHICTQEGAFVLSWGGCRQGLCGLEGATVLPGVMCLYHCLVGHTAVVPQRRNRQGVAPHTRR